MAARKTTKAKTVKVPTPSERLEKIGMDVICVHVCNGESLLSWCDQNGFAYSTVMDWIEKDETRTMNYARARATREERNFESLAYIGDQAVSALSAVTVAGLRLKADNLKWKLARMNPKRFGDKLAVGGADDLPPIQQNVAITADEAYRRMLDNE